MNRLGQSYGMRFINIILSMIVGVLIFLFYPSFSEITFYMLNGTVITNDNANIIGAILPIFWMILAVAIPLFTIFVGGGGEPG